VTPVDDVLARVHREEHSRLLATLVRRFGDLDLAEDAAQEAMEAAVTSWPVDGVPRHPLAWLITTARRRALDRIRRDSVLARRIAELHLEERGQSAPAAEEIALDGDSLPDERLAMLMGCCHPAIAPADRIALMLRFVGGLSTAEVAQALLLPVTTLQARLTRVKKRIVANRIPLGVPEDPDDRERRLPLVLTAISLVFTEGYDATSGEHPQRAELTAEAIRLARITARLMPSHAEPTGLLALLLLTDARAAARVDRDGVPVPLEDQDRTRWDRGVIVEGIRLAERAATMPGAGRFAIQAAIAAVHAESPTFAATDWAQIVALYDLLLAQGEDPVVRMNRAIAVGRRDRPSVGLALLRALAGEPELANHHPYHVALALFLDEVGEPDEARAEWARALQLVDNGGLRRFIERKLV
jgi:RNA polymerase sigma-70 factor, ECF subfamily